MFGFGKIKITDPMKKGEKYLLIFKYYGDLTQTKIDKIIEKVKSQLSPHLDITRIAFDEPRQKKVSVEGIAKHDPIPFILIGGLIGGVAILWGIRLALESVQSIFSIFTPNKVVLLCLLLGVPYLIFSGRLSVKGLKVKGLK